MPSLHHKWYEMNVDLIIGGKSADNIPYLKLFLLDYKQEFSVETVNASCQKCIVKYHKDFINKFRKMENTSKYKLLAKREGLQLEFGGSTFVTNENITDRYAEKLVKRFKELNPNFKMEDLFEVYPKEISETPIKKAKKTTK